MKFTSLVSAAQLAQHLNDPDWIIFDCRFTLSNPDSGRQAHQTGHIPGARYAHLNDDLSSEVTSHSGRHPLPDAQLLAQKLGKWGVDNSKQVIVYDDSFGSMASRMWWLLRWLGHESVARWWNSALDSRRTPDDGRNAGDHSDRVRSSS